MASIRAGVSVGVILSIASLSAFFTAVVFYFAYGEKLHLKHMIGMFIMLMCLGSIAMSKGSRPRSGNEEENHTLPVFIPIFLTLA